MSTTDTIPATIPVAAHQIAIVVYGNPAPQGSKRVVRGGTMIDVNPAALREWREDVKQAALAAMRTTPGWFRQYPAIVAHFAFTLPRPKSHYWPVNQTRLVPVLREDAPHLHASTPDLDKLTRSTCDALTASGVYVDDARVAQLHAAKVYVAAIGTGAMDRPGARIVLTGVNQS